MRPARSRHVAAVVLATTVALVAAPAPQPVEAAWQDAESGAATFAALSIPKPVYLAGASGCSISTTSVLGVGLVINSYTLTFAMPEGYGAADIQVGGGNTSSTIALASAAVTPAATSPTPNPTRQYSITFNRALLDGLLTGLLGGSGYLGVRVAPSSLIVPPLARDTIWTSPWAVVQVGTGLLGTNPTCAVIG
ncbi:hypothetical protein [Plantibacter sp. lyk4-40-MEA-4]|uniref:hypothetical protein n=1 Tax=Plantibacter sp. lyk4-40-MEA-4 TaxID=3040298 RepID=UPI00254F46F2|nr:hypothetical protein [Plantibacter sp. lyk4-40-MEA-4]